MRRYACLEAVPRELRRYETPDGDIPFGDWMDSLGDNPIFDRIMVKLDRAERGNLGDARSVGGGVSELEIDSAEGYRIYFGQVGPHGEIVVLLNGGTKKTQDNDIKLAQKYWRAFNAE